MKRSELGYVVIGVLLAAMVGGLIGAAFLLLLALWSTKSLHGMGSGLVAWLGVAVLIIGLSMAFRIG